MTTYERINEIKNNADLRIENAEEAYTKAELELANLIGDYVIGAAVSCKAYGSGRITAYTGTSIESLIVEIEFADITKKFSLMHIATVGKFVTLEDILEIGTVWDEAMTVHNDLTKQLYALKQQARALEVEAAKKAAAEKKAEEQYQRTKTKALRDFEALTQTTTAMSTTDEFYYAIGWLANHIGAMTAILPDYLGSAFEKHFGAEAPKTLVDGRAKTSGGYAKQWSWEFKCTIKKLKDTVVPTCIQDITTDFAKGIHNTSFLWDLVDNYGFQFGKKQDIAKIRACIPNNYISFFEAGLTA